MDDKTLLLTCVVGSIITWNAYFRLKSLLKKVSAPGKDDWVPVGRVASLFIYPIKSCQAVQVFSYFCTELGPVSKQYFDRFFVVTDGRTGKFLHGSDSIKNGFDEKTVEVDLNKVREKNEVKTAKLHCNLRTDGIDCGDIAAAFFSAVIHEPDVRLLWYQNGMFTERTCVTDPDWWNNPVPKRVDDTAFADLAPYMITTEASLEDLNSKLEKPVSSINFRPVMVVSDCPAWDEDRWAEIRIGDDVRLECFKPCTRCILTTVDPATGIKDGGMQPLKKLKEFRMAPDGKMRDSLKDSPIFGVNAGLVSPGYVHVGQTVWARYKPSAF
ncbi:unnamed protein product [Caenorhabditis auriculariae]|uniref:MOSC domain-containing protein n=1 Tax=Caenorhabditis auriculariae TaxID=2777116 RepID=A0A8S1HDC4_9PELO|nr:unnamed protein product [Caenorhabditis auriculariae]